jgi:hypothetical protein
MDRLNDGLSRLVESKRLQVLRQTFDHIREQGAESQATIVRDTLQNIARRGSSDPALHMMQEGGGLVKSIVDLTNVLEPMLNQEQSEEVKQALRSTLEQGVRLQNTIGHGSLTSSLAQAAQEHDAMNLSTSSSVTNSAMISNLSFRERWNSSTRVSRIGNIRGGGGSIGAASRTLSGTNQSLPACLATRRLLPVLPLPLPLPLPLSLRWGQSRPQRRSSSHPPPLPPSPWPSWAASPLPSLFG